MTSADGQKQFDYGAYFRRVRELETLSLSAEEVTWKQTYMPPERSVEVLLYLGCNILVTGHLAAEVVAVFRHLGIDFEAVGGPQYCCGIVHHMQGDGDAGKRLSAATVRKFESYEAKTLVMWCPSCDLHFDEIVLPNVAPDFAPAITHATQFLADRADALPFRFPVRSRVAVHTHVGRPQQHRDAEACHTLLDAVPGLEIVGTLSSEQLPYHCPTPPTAEDRKRFLAERGRLLDEARELGADTLATIYHSCHREWCEAHSPQLPITNYISLVAQSLGCATEDRYRQLRQAGTPDEVVSRSEAQWRSHGWNEAQAKEAARRYFSATPPQHRTTNG